MSLILEALRKMEQERKSRRGTAHDIRPEVLRYRASAKPTPPKPYLLVAIGLVLITAGIGAGILLKGTHGESVAKDPVALSSASVPLAPTAPVPTAALPAAVPSATVPAPSAPVVVQPARMAAEPAAESGSRPSSAAAPVGPSRSRQRKREAALGSSRVETVGPLHQETSEAPQLAIPEISISGIAWQDERRLRRAVLNGALVGEGAEVAGARVVEIRENKVRMSRGGQIFEVFLSSGFPSR